MEEAEKRQAVERLDTERAAVEQQAEQQTPAGEGSAETGTETSPNGGNGGNSLLDAVRTLYEKGKAAASKLYSRTYFNVAKTPDFMKELGLTGDRFTIRYGVISRHMGKDGAHEIPVEVWEQLPEALQRPFAITEYYESGEDKASGKNKGYRLYTAIKHGDGYIVVGAEVKNVGRDVEVNSISTVFGRDRRGDLEKEIYRSKEITPEQSSLLDGPNSHQYPTEQESSADKGTTNTGNAQGGGAENAQVKTGQELEKSAKKRQAAVEQQAAMEQQAAETQATETPVVETPTQTEATEGLADVPEKPATTESRQADAGNNGLPAERLVELDEKKLIESLVGKELTTRDGSKRVVKSVDGDTIVFGAPDKEKGVKMRTGLLVQWLRSGLYTPVDKNLAQKVRKAILEDEARTQVIDYLERRRIKGEEFMTSWGISSINRLDGNDMVEIMSPFGVCLYDIKEVYDLIKGGSWPPVRPVGNGPFGNIYDQFKGKATDAFDFLFKNKGGHLKRGVPP